MGGALQHHLPLRQRQTGCPLLQKRDLPYEGYSTKRYFTAASLCGPLPWSQSGSTYLRETTNWQPGPALAAKAAGAELLLTINASPSIPGETLDHRELMKQALRSNRSAAGLPQSGLWPG